MYTYTTGTLEVRATLQYGRLLWYVIRGAGSTVSVVLLLQGSPDPVVDAFG
jgi:hypothetical protein